MKPPTKNSNEEKELAKMGLAPMLKFTKPKTAIGNRVLLYGTGGIGKTTLAAAAPGEVVFFDLDNSLGKLGLENSVVEVESWVDLLEKLRSDWPAKVKTIVIDSVTRAEELCIEYVLQTVKVANQAATSLEDYGYGKDVRYVFEKFQFLLMALDRHFREGRNVILIAHECTPETVNPTGQNWLRFEPRLRSSKKGDNSIRLKAKEWCDFVGFLNYDVSVKDKKGEGKGSRTLYLSEMPGYMAKNRGCEGPIDIVHGKEAAVWKKIFNQ
jgi:AAA domain